MEETSEEHNWKEVSSLLSIIDHLTFHLPHHGAEFEQVYQWFTSIAVDKTIGEFQFESYLVDCHILTTIFISDFYN